MADQDQAIATPQSTGFTVPPAPELSALKTDVNQPMFDYGAAAKEKSPTKLLQQQADIQKRLGEEERLIGANKIQQEEYAASAEADIQKQARQKRDEILTKEQELKAKFPYPEFHPTQDNINNLAVLFSGISLLGSAIGGRGRMSSMNSLASMTGMMKGWREGRADLWKKEKETFDIEFKRVKEILDDVKADTDRAMERMAYDVNEAQAVAKQAAAKLGSQVANQILNKQGLERFSQYVDGIYKTRQEIQNKLDEHKFQLELHKMKMYTTEGELVQAYTGVMPAKKDAEEITNTARAMGEAYALSNLAKTIPENVGRSGQINAFVDRYIKSYDGMGQAPSDEEAKAAGLDQSSLIFAKRYAAYLVNYERSLAGGARGFTVQFQNRFNKLMASDQFTPPGLQDLLIDHVRELADSAASKGKAFNVDNMSRMAIDISTRSGDDNAALGYQEAQRKRSGATETKPAKAMPDQSKLKAYADAHFNGDVNKATEYLRSQGYQ